MNASFRNPFPQILLYTILAIGQLYNTSVVTLYLIRTLSGLVMAMPWSEVSLPPAVSLLLCQDCTSLLRWG